MKKREDKRMVKLDLLFKIALIGRILKKLTHSLFGAWSFLMFHFWFTLNEGPKGFVLFLFLRNQTMEVGPSSQTLKKCYLPWCKPALSIMNMYSYLFGDITYKHHIRYFERFPVFQFNDSLGGVDLKCTQWV
jgi:hypothetical protein